MVARARGRSSSTADSVLEFFIVVRGRFVVGLVVGPGRVHHVDLAVGHTLAAPEEAEAHIRRRRVYAGRGREGSQKEEEEEALRTSWSGESGSSRFAGKWSQCVPQARLRHCRFFARRSHPPCSRTVGSVRHARGDLRGARGPETEPGSAARSCSFDAGRNRALAARGGHEPDCRQHRSGHLLLQAVRQGGRRRQGSRGAVSKGAGATIHPEFKIFGSCEYSAKTVSPRGGR